MKYGLFELTIKAIVYLIASTLGIDREFLWRKVYSKHLKKYIPEYKILPTNEYNKNGNNKLKNQNYFTCWFQGEDKAPKIVQQCFKSMRKYGYNIQIVTKKNLDQYITLPEYILHKWKSGIITDTHMSDIIRVCLLDRYGGTWFDSTIMLTGRIPKFIEDEDVFFFRSSFLESKKPYISSWFIFSRDAENPLIKGIKYSLFNYWRRNNGSSDYYLFHDIIHEMSILEGYDNIMNNMRYCDNIMPHYVQFNFNNDVDKYMRDVLKIYPIQKLTYKFNDTEVLSNSVLDNILKGKLY